MFFLVFTILYCLLTRLVNLDYLPAVGIYLIGLSLVKGWSTQELMDVFNLRKAKYLYDEYGFKNSFIELLSLIIIVVNSFLIYNQPLTLFEYIYIVFLITIVFRFIFWGIIHSLKQGYLEKLK